MKINRRQPTAGQTTHWLRAALFGLVLTGCNVGNYVEVGSVTQTFEVVETLDALDVGVRAGSLRVQPSESDRVKVGAHLMVSESMHATMGSAPLLFKDHADVTWEDGKLSISDPHRDSSEKDDWQVSYSIFLPVAKAVGRALDLDLSVAAGELQVTLPAIGSLTARSGAGEVSVAADRVVGPVDLSVAAGECRLAIAEEAPAENVKIDIGTGGLSLTLPEGASGKLEADVAVGTLSVAARYGIAVERSLTAANAKGQFGAEGPDYKIEVAVGECTVR